MYAYFKRIPRFPSSVCAHPALSPTLSPLLAVHLAGEVAVQVVPVLTIAYMLGVRRIETSSIGVNLKSR